MKTMRAFVRERNLSIRSAEEVDANPNMEADPKWEARHYKLVLIHPVEGERTRQMTVYFSQGMAHEASPEIEEVLDCIASDSRGVHPDYCRGFEEWAGDPPAAQNDIETVSTTATDSYKEVASGDIDDAAIDADDYIFLHVPSTDVDWIHVQIIYHVTEGN